MSQSYVERILRARVYEVARETPLERAVRLSARLAQRVWLKREDLQPVFSFKLRGAYNCISALAPEAVLRGVRAASAGNHAQGVAMAAARRGIAAEIVMPHTTPSIKVEAVAELGAEIVLHGDTLEQAQAEAQERCEQDGRTLVPPFDHPDVIAGQGTVAVEILRQHPDPIDAIFVPVGGGGLAAGIAAYAKFVRPETSIIGVEPEDAACLHAALGAGRPVTLERVGLFADGVAVARVGDEPFRLLQDRIDGVIRVETDEICAAIQDVFEDTRTIAEPAGALAVAGLKRFVEEKGGENRTLVAILSGANVNFHRLRHVSERAELGEGREAVLAVTIPEEPGSFLRFCESLGDLNLTEFNYRYANPSEAHVFVGVQLGGKGERADLVERMREAGYPVVDMTENELAKLHGRHLVGGVAQQARHERVFRFEFPERPGALLYFLRGMGNQGFNLSLFHYRNHGAAQGRVLAGMQVPPAEAPRFQRFLDELGYEYAEETSNPAYRLFLAPSESGPDTTSTA